MKRRGRAHTSFWRVPIICVAGEAHCGKSVVSRFLSQYLEYTLIVFDQLPKASVECLKTEIAENLESLRGFVIDGFPRCVDDARKLEDSNRIKCIIYVTLKLDALLARILKTRPAINLNNVRITHIEQSRKLAKILKVYRKNSVKVYSQFPVHKTMVHLSDLLEDNFGIVFKIPSTAYD